MDDSRALRLIALGVAIADGLEADRGAAPDALRGESASRARRSAARDDALLALAEGLGSSDPLERVVAAAVLRAVEARGADAVDGEQAGRGVGRNDGRNTRADVPRVAARVADVLAESEASADRTVALMARMALAAPETRAGIVPPERAPASPTVPARPAAAPPTTTTAPAATTTTTTSVLVHGSFARLLPEEDRWYEPDAPLARLLRSTCTPDLYADPADDVRWGGGYSAAARATGADDLIAWCAARGLAGFDTVFAHSHGGNVVLDAVERGLRVTLLVLLHTPVVPREQAAWATIGQGIGRVVDLRTDLDVVTHLDRLFTGSRNGFAGEIPQVRRLQQPLPATLDLSHWTFTEVETWRRYDLPREIRRERDAIPETGLPIARTVESAGTASTDYP